MDKSYIIKKIIKLGLTLAILFALYVIGCNAVKGEVVTDSPAPDEQLPAEDFTPLPYYTFAPATSSPSPDEEAPTADPPIFYMPPHNENIQFRYFAWWRNASGTVLFQAPSGSVGSSPPYYASYPYTDGDVSTLDVSLDKSTASIPYSAEYDFDIIVNMNKNPITETAQYENYKISFLFGDFEVVDVDDPSIKLDYSVTISVKVSGVDESGSYVSKNYSYSINRKNFEKSGLAEAEIKGLSEFFSINRLDCTLSVEAVLPEAYASADPAKAPHLWYLDVHDLHFTDRLEYGVFGVVTGMFIPSSETLADFINSKIAQDLPSGYDTALSMVGDVLNALTAPLTLKSCRITIPSWSITVGGTKYQVFKGGWFDLKNFAYSMTGSGTQYSGTSSVEKIWEWVRTINNVLITIEFVYLVFRYFLSIIKSVRFDMLGHYPTDDDVAADEMRHEKIQSWRRRHPQ